MKWFVVLLTLALFSSAAMARTKKSIPLLPSRVASSDDVTSPLVPPYENTVTAAPNSEGIGLGFEVGAMGRQTTTDGRTTGLDLLPGGRLFVEFNLTDGIVIRPSAGYFGKPSTVGTFNIFQNDFEAGLTAYLEAALSTQARFLFGVTNRMDFTLSTVSILNSTGSTSSAIEYRPGPAISLEISLAAKTQLVISADATLSLIQTVQPYGSITVGISQILW